MFSWYHPRILFNLTYCSLTFCHTAIFLSGFLFFHRLTCPSSSLRPKLKLNFPCLFFTSFTSLRNATQSRARAGNNNHTMGNIASALNSFFSSKRNMRLLMVGLDASGKTTVLYKLKLGDLITSIPTIGFNVETVEYKNLKFTMWDVGGQDKLRPLWRHYFEHNDAIIFVVDSNDRDRVSIAKDELQKLTSEDALRDATLLVFANKQDLPNAMSPAELTDKLGLHSLKGREWYMQGSCAASGEGLYEGLDWLASALKKRP